jgi:hypothetical protein
MLNYAYPFYEVAIVGDDAFNKISELNSKYLPNIILAGNTKESNLPLLANRYVDNQTFIYVCVNKACKLPVLEVEKAFSLIMD